MSKLTDFYDFKSHIFDINGDCSRWDALEEKLIREEILPELINRIKPILTQVKSPLSLNISYDPNGNLALSMTRNCIQAIDVVNTQKIEAPLPDKEETEEEEEEDNSIKSQFLHFLLSSVKEATAKNYIRVLENQITGFIHSESISEADSIFSITDKEEIEICKEMLKESEAFLTENKRMHNSMSAALKLYQQFIDTINP